MLSRRENIHKLRRNIVCASYYGAHITWNELENYLDETFYSALDCWYNTTLYGLANNAGWANEPMEYIQAIRALESEKNMIEREEMDKRLAESKKSSGGNSKG